MSTNLISQRFVYKIHSSRLRRANWNLQLSINQARENKELVTLNESQLMCFIDELNGTPNQAFYISDIKAQIKALGSEKNLSVSRPKIKKLYKQLDEYQFKKDYVCVIMDNNRDYKLIYKNGFKINNIKFRRLLGTTGGVKSNTIVFVNEKLLPELKKRINNGRDLSKEHVPAKLEAYFSLVCSSSTPVSMPKGVAVVHDCITHFKADVIELDDTDLDTPRMKYVHDKDMTLNDSDGYGLAMPQLMERWGKELNEKYVLPACVIRNSFCKGAVFPVDFQKFARENGFTEITDVWGNTYNINEVELILTESMLKLWDSYASLESYMENCMKNNYTFAITKYSKEKLEHVRTMNYQFLQSYDFTEEQLEELIAPTVNEIMDILTDDYRKAIIYTNGSGLNETSIQHLDSSFATALMIEPEMKNDPFVQGQIHSMIRKRMNDAKVGVLTVDGNYSFVSGDPYSLCQSMFGMRITGLLKAGQIYSKYWVDKGVNEIVSFRAPMTSHNNIRKLKVVHNEKMDDFYQYMVTPTIFNSWDTCAEAMNGMDKDGDCVINTSSPVLVSNTKNLPAIQCIQQKAPKCIVTEDDLMQSNINSFGNAVGEVTNKITSMFEVQAEFPKNSREYRMLDYRIKCGQLYQQNAIDKTKGIVANVMPDKWYNKLSNKCSESATSAERKEKLLNCKILANKKPYFMQYIYPAERTKLTEYNKRSNEKCIMQFRISLNALLQKENKTNEEEKFLERYYQDYPLGQSPCTVNRICKRLESIFDNISFEQETDFDYSILKCGASYSKDMYNKIKKVYDRYINETKNYIQYAKSERLHAEELQIQKYLFKERFKRQCLEQCPNEEYLCDIVLDLCYSGTKTSKQFAWDICGDMFIKNLLKRHNYKISYPKLNPDGDIVLGGKTFSMYTATIKETDEDATDTEDLKCQLY